MSSRLPGDRAAPAFDLAEEARRAAKLCEIEPDTVETHGEDGDRVAIVIATDGERWPFTESDLRARFWG